MQDETKQVTCRGCLLGNPFLCRSFAGKAPKHAKAFASREARRLREYGQKRDAKREKDIFKKAKE